MKINYIDWITNPKAGSGLIIEIEIAIKNQLSAKGNLHTLLVGM